MITKEQIKQFRMHNDHVKHITGTTSDLYVFTVDQLNSLVKNLSLGGVSESLRIGRFSLQKATEVEGFDRQNMMWVKADDGEGTDIDLEKIFKQEM